MENLVITNCTVAKVTYYDCCVYCIFRQCYLTDHMINIPDQSY